MKQLNLKDLNLNDYPMKSYDKIRYGDTDRQHHVNNAVFSTFLETGRVELLNPLISSGVSFVIVSMKLDLVSEILWPGTVDIGTAVVHIGNSSVRFFQGLFQNGKAVARAETIIVHTDEQTRRSKPLTQETIDLLKPYMLKG